MSWRIKSSIYQENIRGFYGILMDVQFNCYVWLPEVPTHAFFSKNAEESTHGSWLGKSWFTRGMTWNGDEWSVFPQFLGETESAPSRLRALDIPRRFGKGLGLSPATRQRWATAQRHKPWGARPRLAIGDGGELHADGEVARDLRQKSHGKSHGKSYWNRKVPSGKLT